MCTEPEKTTTRLILVSAGAILENLLPSSVPSFAIECSLGNPAILSSVGARLLLNMKEVGENGLNEGMGISGMRATVDEMSFAAPPTQAENAEYGE